MLSQRACTRNNTPQRLLGPPLQVILMDHLDWLDDKATREVAAALAKQVGGGDGPRGMCVGPRCGRPGVVSRGPAWRYATAALLLSDCAQSARTCLKSCSAHVRSRCPDWQVAPGGRVIWRSAAFVPPYAAFIRDAGFDVKCIQRADQARRSPGRVCCVYPHLPQPVSAPVFHSWPPGSTTLVLLLSVCSS